MIADSTLAQPKFYHDPGLVGYAADRLAVDLRQFAERDCQAKPGPLATLLR